MDSVSTARGIAFRILERVQAGGYASDLLRREMAGSLNLKGSLNIKIDARDAALAETLVFGCLRFQGQLDYLIAHFSGRPQPKLDAEVRLALRMGIYQLRYLERVPAHAAVTESVELVKQARKRSAAGFVNAVLRKVTREPVRWPDRATELSLPPWMLQRWIEHYGAAVAEKIARAALEEPESHVNPVTGRQQDQAAQAIVPLLEIEPGMTLLDVCAAPGNKTAQAVAAGARVVACDRSPDRLKEVRLKETRLHEVLREAQLVALDAGEPLPFGVKFDRILVDVPCTGTGTLARNPEIKWRLQPSDVERFPPLQRRILERALDRLKPGGRLVYSTCSLESEENEGVVAGLPVSAKHAWLPGQGSAGDGFFAAVITSA